MNNRIILHTLGWVLNFEAIAMLVPTLCAAVYQEECIYVFAVCIALCFLIGIPLTVKKPKNLSLYSKEGYIIVALGWIVMSIFGALPFVLSNSIPNFVDAFFETVSGFTTTGATILTDIEALPKSMLLWRSFTHWLGGMGVLVLLVAVLPLSGGSNLYIMKAESPGPTVSKLVPRVRTTAKILYGIYSVMTLIMIVLLMFGKIGFYESLNIAFSTAGTGGFGVKNTSMAEYSSYIQNITTVFMILFGVNFSIYYLILIGKFKEVFRSTELKAYLGIIFTSVVLIAINSYSHFSGVLDAIKHSAFQVAAIITTTGMYTKDFNLWPEFSKHLLILIMFIGASAGSTGGGIKVIRVITLLKTITKEIRLSMHPKRVFQVSVDGKAVEHETIRATNVFLMSYIALFIVCLMIISLDNYDFTTNFTAVATTINNVGPGLNLIGPVENFSFFSPLSKLVFSVAMLGGRLEIFPLLILFMPSYWKK